MNNKKPIFQYVILISSIILLITNILFSVFQDAKTISIILRIGSNVLIIIAMILTIRSKNKKTNT